MTDFNMMNRLSRRAHRLRSRTSRQCWIDLRQKLVRRERAPPPRLSATMWNGAARGEPPSERACPTEIVSSEVRMSVSNLHDARRITFKVPIGAKAYRQNTGTRIQT